MKTVRLFGDLEKYKPVWTLDVKTPSEALRAIGTQRAGFLVACDAGHYVAVLMDVDNPDMCRQISNETAHDPWANEELWILPVLNGEVIAPAMIAAAFMSVAGVALPTFAAYMVAAVVNIGLSLAFSAVANAITGKKRNTSASAQERPESKPSFISNGAVNVTVAGHPHPIVAGRVRDCGSVVLSSNYWVEDVPV